MAFVVPARAVDAQTDPQPPTTTEPAPGPPAAGQEVTPEWVQARISEVEQAGSMEESLKASLLKAYNDTLVHLRAAEEWAKKAAEYEQARQDAPNLLQEIKAELARPPAEPKPEVQGDESVQQLEQLLAQREAELKAAQNRVTELEEERKRRTDRRQQAPQQVAAARQELEEVSKALEQAAPAEDPQQLVEAKRRLLLARKRALDRQIEALEREILSYDARGELLTARIDRAARRATEQEALVKAWREIVNERRKQEADRLAREAKRARREAAQAHPALSALLERNALLGERPAKENLAGKIKATRERLGEVEKLRTDARQEFKDLGDKLEAVGLTKAMALLLRNKLESLPDVQVLGRNIPRREAEMSAIQIALLNAQDERRALQPLEPRLRELMEKVGPGTNEIERQEFEAAARDLLERQRKLLDTLIDNYETYFSALVELDNAEKQFTEEIRRYEDFIRERILWVPSTSPPRPSDLAGLAEATRWFLAPVEWSGTLAALRAGATSAPFAAGAAALMLLLLVIAQPRLRRRLRALGERADKGTTIEMRPTLGAALVTVLLALPGPALFAVAALLLSRSLESSAFVSAVGTGLRTVAALLMGVELVRWVCRPGGLAEAHLQWPAPSLRSVRRHLYVLVAVMLPCAFVLSTVESAGNEDYRATLGRLAFIVGHLGLAVFAHRLVRPGGPVIQGIVARNPNGWVKRLRYVLYLTAVGLPLVLVVLAVAGYYYTAFQLAKRLQATLSLALVLLVTNALLLRWAMLARRRLALEQLRKRRALAQTEGKGEAPAPGGEAPTELEAAPAVDLRIIGVQTGDLIRSVVGITLLVGLWFVWVDVLPALGMLNVELWSTTTTVAEAVTGAEEGARTTERSIPVTLGDLITALVVLVITFVATKNLPGLLEIAVLQRLPLVPSSRYAVTTVSRYLLTIVGLVIASGMIGISWSKVQWLAAAITVGLGFGLQEIFANFVSGLIILFERPVRVGDIVTVGDTHGKVTRIRMRATTILDWDNRELLVPNKDFITGQLINWTLSEPVTRIVIPVGIAYGSNTELARELMLKVGRESKYVMDDPAPSAVFREFGDSALLFDFRIYIASRDVWPDVMHEMHTNIDREFRKAGIEIAFPQRDIHIRSIRDALPISERRGRDVVAQPE